MSTTPAESAADRGSLASDHWVHGGSVCLRIDLPDSSDVRNFGMTQLAESALEDVANNYTYRYSVVSVDGPDQATECYRCGCDFHGNGPCSDCDHPLCSKEHEPISVIEPTMPGVFYDRETGAIIASHSTEPPDPTT